LRQLDIPFVDLGEQRMKNIAEPVRAFVVEPNEEIADAAGRRKPYERPTGTMRTPRLLLWIGLLAALLLAGTVAGLLLRKPTETLAELSVDEVSAAPGEQALARATRAAILDMLGTISGVLLIPDETAARSINSFSLHTGVGRAGSDLRFSFIVANANTRSPLLTYLVNRPVAERAVAAEQAAMLAKQVVGCLLSGVNTHPGALPDRVLTLYGQICEDSWDDTLGFGGTYDHARSITSLSPTFSLGWSARAYYAAQLARNQKGDAREALIDDARLSATKAEALNPNNSEIFLAREQLLPASATHERERLLRRSTQAQLTYNGYEHLFYGQLLTELGRHEDAALSLQRAYDLNPMDPVVGRYLVDGLSRVDRQEDARTLLSRLRRVWPSNASLSQPPAATVSSIQ
jgi:tetratricopeptide (TPR) repeat protein